ISTNVLEGIFSVDATSQLSLIRHGFLHTSITNIPPTSRIQNPKTIVQILRNTEACFSDLKGVMNDSSSFSWTVLQDLVKTIHGKLLKDGNIEVEEDEDGARYAVLIPRGVYRRVPCYTTHEGTGVEVRFCPWDQIESEIEWFFTSALTVLSHPRFSPFHSAAFLHHTFLRIHPFADGNGRVSRILSSIPLLRTGLPPVAVSPERKD
ncbi:fido domain-containing protein, partial [Fimicolochytrium jonesii]|uniref:fido domain-containing protein n=1 Tax=Fimicolochytrium jonesii TaxID=1396493 RepID=UPI0022FE6895